jgi:hypothetical protein
VTAAVVVALVGAAAGILTSILAARIALGTQLRVARLTAALEERRAESDARRAYEYEARKRLYSVYEPLRVRLLASTDNALAQIADIVARPGRAGTTDSSPEYRLKAAMYYLLAPLVVARMIERQLTLIDLGLDDRIHTEFVLAQVICRSLADEAYAAEIEPRLPYTPYVPGWREKRVACPQQFRRQGLPLGRLNTALDVLHITRPEGIETLMSFGEFEPLVDQLDVDDVRTGPGAARDLIVDFDPISRPVLWRVLIIEALLYWRFQQTVFGERLSENIDLEMPFLASDVYKRLKDAVESRPDADQVEPLGTTATVAVRYFGDRVVPGLRRVKLLARAATSPMTD